MIGTSNKHIFEKYEDVEELIKTINTSKVKTRILISLTKKPMRLSDISDSVGCKQPNTHSELKTLREMRLVDNENKRYSLSVFGKIVKDKLIDHINHLHNFKEYALLLNQFNDLPDSFINELESLINSQKLKNDEVNLLNNQDIFNSGKDLKLVLPIFNLNLLNLLSERTSNGLNTEIIVPSALINHISKLKNSEEYSETMKSLINSQNIEIMKMENALEMGLGVNGKWMSVGLYKIGNTYDFTSHYTSYDDNAVEFANELFKHYKKISDEVEKDEL